ASHSDNAGLRSYIHRLIDGRNDPTDRTHVDNRAALRLLHARDDCLRHKELMLQVDSNGVVPELRRHVGSFVPRVIAGIVDEHVYCPETVHDCLDRMPYGGGMGEITGV